MVLLGFICNVYNFYFRICTVNRMRVSDVMRHFRRISVNGGMKITKRLYGLASLISLILGMCIYLFFRDLNYMILFKSIPKPEFAKTILVQLKPSTFSYILKYNFPYMLWFLSGILLMRFIWFFNIKIQKIYVLCFYGIGFVYVLCKMSDKFPGTFDWLDLLFKGIGAFVESLLYKKFILRRFV